MVGGELWIRRPNSTVIAVQRKDLSTRQVDVPPGQLVASRERTWSIEPGPDGSTARSLDGDGATLRTLHIGHLAEPTVWGDGDGGLWLAGSALARPSRAGADAGLVVDVVGRPFAMHVTEGGATSASWWAEEVRQAATWFVPAGHGLGVIDPEGLTMLSR